MNRARDIEFEVGWFSGGIRLYPYQVGFGMTLSFWPCIKRPDLSLYIGPLKVWIGISGVQVVAFVRRIWRRLGGKE